MKSTDRIHEEQKAYQSIYSEGEIPGFDGFKRFVYPADILAIEVIVQSINKDEKENIAITDLGCGKGELCIQYLQQIKNLHSFYGYDINLGNVLSTIRTIPPRIKNALPGGCKIECSNLNKKNLRVKSDYIIALNSFYGINFEKIPAFLELLKDGGKMYILLNSLECFSIQFAKVINIQEVVSAVDLEHFLSNHHFKYESHNINVGINRQEITTCNDLIRYLLRTDTFDTNKVNQIIAQMEDRFFNLNQTLFVISK